MEQIGSYVNGNTIVVLYDDGTKERYIRDGEKPYPVFPESMDLKITNYCDLGCVMCAESSSGAGKHADLNDPVLTSIHPYTELAIGGGNPLSHPDLHEFLKRMKKQKVICNITVNQKHFMENLGYLYLLSDQKLIHGIGVSVPSEPMCGLIDKLQYFPNAVVHTIAGYTPLETYVKFADHNLKILILGYKNKGRGSELLRHHIGDMYEKTVELEQYLRNDGHKRYRCVAFDNLAVDQLRCKEWMPYEYLKKFYMGNDGEYTMYIDLVKREYAKSSTHRAYHIGTDVVSELFEKIRWYDTWTNEE